MDNVDIAILSVVNALLERHRIGPTDVVASIKHHDDGHTELLYASPPKEQEKMASYWRMLKNIGIQEGHSSLIGTDDHIYRSLTSALSLAPPPVRRDR